MFFTKIEADSVVGPRVDHIRCTKCHHVGYQLHGKIKYLSVEFINLPILILKQDYQFTCECCGHQQKPCVKPKQFKQLKQQMLPWYYFAAKYIGLVLFVFIALMIAQSMQDTTKQGQEQRQLLLQNPQVNDFYFVDYHRIEPDSHPKYRYTVLKVTNVVDDKITLLVGNIFKKREGRVYDHVKADRPMINGFFSSNTIELTKAQLDQYSQNETIFALRRPKGFYIDGSIVIPRAQPQVYQHQVNMDNQLGIALYRGEDGYYQDYEAAFEAFSRAAQANHAAGQHNLAQMYRDGIGTERDMEKALYWFSKAASQGYAKAVNAKQQLLDTPPGAFLPPNAIYSLENDFGKVANKIVNTNNHRLWATAKSA